MQCSTSYAGVGFRVRLPQIELEYPMKTDEFEIPSMECRAKRSRAVFKISGGFHTPCGRPAVAAAECEFAKCTLPKSSKIVRMCHGVHFMFC